MDTQQQQPNPKRLSVYTIREARPGTDRNVWTRIGAAFLNRDGSYNLHLDALPLNGKLQMREESERARKPAQLEAEVLP